ncbi:helix-turn-helix domain-containing protein [Peribacillus sp. NPDC096379]|uniref:helix-turn-helix domain-containing protein n=1 Tax=Peribacillus sp. NPDC096379 TaxID=3364393 RepID=UPI00380F0454
MDNNLELGKVIAKFRIKRNYNIKQLAEKTNVTSSMISQIERGLTNPSLNTLRVIADALEVPLLSFFTKSEKSKDLITRADARKKIVFPPPQNLEYMLLSPDLSGSIEMVLMKIPPVSQSAENPMIHIGEEVAYVLEGSIVLHIGDDIETLNTGDSVKIPPCVQHKWENITDKEATIIFAVTPPTF